MTLNTQNRQIKQASIPHDQLDMSSSISFPKGSPNKDNSNSIGYNINGESDKGKSKFNEVDIAAMSLNAGKEAVYRIKALRNGRLFNPLKVNMRYGLDKRDPRTKDNMFKFKTVGKDAFNNYVNFLKTRNDSLIFIAQRLSNSN